MIRFTKHAEDKFTVLRKHGFRVLREQVLETVQSPDSVDADSRYPIVIAQRTIDDTHVLRVVYKEFGSDIKIITFYPGRSKKYGKTI